MNKSKAAADNASRVWVGVDIGGTKTAIVLSAKPPSILCRVEFPTIPAQGPDRVLDLIKRSLSQMLESRNISKGRLAAIGVSCGGPLDRVKGVIQTPPNLATWVDVPITLILEKEFATACKLQNDANAGAVAEHRFGAGIGARNMVFLTMGTGIGAGIIVDGHLYHGTSDLAGEIGHVRLTRAGPVGHNKAGSVEGWASGAGMAAIASREIALAERKGASGALLKKRGTITAKDIAAAARAGDALAKKIIRTCGTRLGAALAILVDVLNPERIVIGGLALRLGDDLLEPARMEMGQEALGAAAKDCQIVPAALGEEIGDVAAICVAMGF